MNFKVFLILYAVALLLCASNGAKILGVFPLAAKSHFTCNNAIMKSLIDAGHEVTVITSFPEQASSHNYTSIIDVSDKLPTFVGKTAFDEFRIQNPYKMLDKSSELELPYCSVVLNLPEIQRILNSNEKLYDVVFVEILFVFKCFFFIAEKMKVPIIGTVTTRTWLIADQEIHNPNHPAYIPFELVTQEWSLDNVFGRMINAWNYIVGSWYKHYNLPRMIEKFHLNYSDQLDSLGKYTDREPDIIFYNNHASLLPKPMNPNTIEIGGIHVKGVKPLPKDLQKFIDEADRGVILFSLGSVVRASTLTTASQKAFRDAFAEIPQRVIWKFEEKMENLSSNVMMLEWLPQRDILEHKNVIAFISHCGLGGINEAVYTATPVVACPLFCDQPDHAETLKNLGVAVHLDIYDITKENVLNALNLIINDTRFYNNMQRLSNRYKDRPMTPQQSVVYWTEYVIRHNGASHFKSPASRLSWFQYFLLDVVLVVMSLLISFGYLVYSCLKFVYLLFSKYLKPSNKPANKTL